MLLKFQAVLVSSSSCWRSTLTAGSFSKVDVLFKLSPSNNILLKPFSVLIKSGKLRDVRAYSKEIATLQKQRKFREAVELFKEMESRSIKANVVICN